MNEVQENYDNWVRLRYNEEFNPNQDYSEEGGEDNETEQTNNV